MSEYSQRHPVASAPGALALATWSIYVLCAVFLYYPDFLASVLIAGFFGLVACAAVIFNIKYWRAAVVLASSVYLLLYAIRVIRMTTMTTDLAFLSALSFYYSASWHVAIGMFQEKSMAGGLTHAFLEYVMPALIVALIGVTLISRPPKPGAG
ncbi:MAG: hypothetical protein HYU44_15920 [Betaproteobacteria bacterium]|nr:hypothetical protein [Betaproteobacteria bacterium]MBI2290159.1 hypothetical protein [Betaproteobacteria bacterium]MBI3054701.1 hypothetical protein [Betaproteobacteria bacterium]